MDPICWLINFTQKHLEFPILQLCEEKIKIKKLKENIVLNYQTPLLGANEIFIHSKLCEWLLPSFTKTNIR